VEAVRITSECLKRGEVTPEHAALILYRALDKFLDSGDMDFARHLGIKPRRGGRYEIPLTINKMEKRNECIKQGFASIQGTKEKKAREILQMYENPDMLSDPILQEGFRELRREFGDDFPTSTKQIIRIIDTK
jgi:hypothetical protein